LGSTLLCITNDEHWYVIVKEIINEALSDTLGKPTPITMTKSQIALKLPLNVILLSHTLRGTKIQK
jgi:hypothetical protein